MTALISIEQIEASLNQLVATRIMGWTSDGGPFMCQEELYAYRRQKADGSWDYTNALPDYVGDLNSAMSVAQEIHRRIDAGEIDPSLYAGYLTLAYGSGETPWYASFNLNLSAFHHKSERPFKIAGWMKEWWAYDYTVNDQQPGFAICRAALDLIQAHEALRKSVSKS